MRWKVCRAERHRDQYPDRQCQRQGILGSDSEKLAGDEARCRIRQPRAERQSGDNKSGGLPEDHTHDSPRPGSQSDADRNLAFSQRDAIRQYPVQANRGESESDGAERDCNLCDCPVLSRQSGSLLL